MSLSYSVSFFNTSATIYQHIELTFIEIFCTLLEVLIDLNQKLERTCSGGFVSSFIHSLKAVSTDRARNFDSSPDFVTFFEQKQGLVEQFYFWELRKFKESFKLLKSNVFLNILTRTNCLIVITISTAKIFHNVITHNRGTNPVTIMLYYP